MHRGQRRAGQGRGTRYQLQCLLCRCRAPACLSKLQQQSTWLITSRGCCTAQNVLSAAFVQTSSLEKWAETVVCRYEQVLHRLMVHPHVARPTLICQFCCWFLHCAVMQVSLAFQRMSIVITASRVRSCDDSNSGEELKKKGFSVQSTWQR